jgi:16S rRNA (uracil1498-N3)-methyltransferase
LASVNKSAIFASYLITSNIDMAEPIFFDPTLTNIDLVLRLNEDESYHAIKVLRLKKDDAIEVTNGNGLLAKAQIAEIIKKQVDLKILEYHIIPPSIPRIHLSICPVKKRDRIEWIIEKATEIGVYSISFFTSQYSERAELNYQRMEKILIGAVKQSGNLYKPILHPIKKFETFITNSTEFAGQKLIAHCGLDEHSHVSKKYLKQSEVMMMIGPEGGFTDNEVSLAIKNGFSPVSLGSNKLRAETAAIYSIVTIKSINALP